MWKPEPESLNEPLSADLGMHAAQLKTKKRTNSACCKAATKLVNRMIPAEGEHGQRSERFMGPRTLPR